MTTHAMFNIGPGELVVILIVALVLLGPDKLPEMARTLGKGMRELRRATEDLKDQVEGEIYKIDEKPRSPIVRAPPGPRVAQAPSVAELPPTVNELAPAEPMAELPATAPLPATPSAEPDAPAEPKKA